MFSSIYRIIDSELFTTFNADRRKKNLKIVISIIVIVGVISIATFAYILWARNAKHSGMFSKVLFAKHSFVNVRFSLLLLLDN